MTITEFVQILEAIRFEHGDIRVGVRDSFMDPIGRDPELEVWAPLEETRDHDAYPTTLCISAWTGCD